MNKKPFKQQSKNSKASSPTAEKLRKHEVQGKRRLAYEIKKFRDGVYVLVNFTAEPAVVTELERIMKISDEVIRYLITNDVA
ncbi:30S ribosomal protein S6 [Paenibacillus sonchi]|uniref:30S ribosomal protein S6 n=1 Tax=Paenibacillus sonchi TaxID=373687 RepID=UPI002D801D82|nr:30S ribosomal protein S6 [Paenibacillus sonchi]